MPICENRKLAFCHIPRTGGVSISNALQLNVIDYHYPASWYRKNYPDYFLFATFRPYEERVKSAMEFEAKKNLGLMLKRNEYFLDTDVDCLLRFWNLNEDLNKMLLGLKLEPVNLIKCNGN